MNLLENNYQSIVKGSGYEYKVQAIPKCIKRNL